MPDAKFQFSAKIHDESRVPKETLNPIANVMSVVWVVAFTLVPQDRGLEPRYHQDAFGGSCVRERLLCPRVDMATQGVPDLVLASNEKVQHDDSTTSYRLSSDAGPAARGGAAPRA
eukprot:756370-Hanusia_phi.AAC.11